MQILRIKLKAYDPGLIESACKKIVETVIRTGAKVRGPVPLPTRVKKWTVIRSPFIDKRSQEAFEQRISSRLVDIVDSNSKTVSSLQSLVLPAGVSVDIKVINSN